MPEYLILLLMQVTIFSSITALIIISVKTVFRCRIPPTISMVLWVVLFARIMCPIYPESRLSVYNLVPMGRDIMYSLANNAEIIEEAEEQRRFETSNPYVLQTSDGYLDGQGNPELQDDAADEESRAADTSDASESAAVTLESKRKLKIIVLAVYVTGIVIAYTSVMLLYRRSWKRTMRSSSVCTDESLIELYRKVALRLDIPEGRLPQLRLGSSDMLVGVISPVVIVRDDVDPKDAEMIFAHELNHYRSRDNLILMVSTSVACLYWYNPLIWLVRHLLREDIEVLCDSRTLYACGIPTTEYAFMLCRLSEFGELRQSLAEGLHMSASGRRLKLRLRTIYHSGESRFLSKLGSVALCMAIVAACLTNPIISQNTEYSSYIANYCAVTGEDERAMQLSGNVTVSTYLAQICTILENNGLSDMKNAVGNGNLEKFRRICGGCENLDSGIINGIRSLRADGVLTNRELVLINSGLCAILAAGTENGTEADYGLLPEAIPVHRVSELSRNLTETERDALLSCYNRGVKGADVEFSSIYTDAMMQLIISRINRDWSREKLLGFYVKYDLDSIDSSYFSPELRATLSRLRNVKAVYICDPNITGNEKKRLSELLGAAQAGQNEDVYYLKSYDDGCSLEVAKLLFRRAGYTLADMLDDYAEIGLVSCSPDAVGAVIPAVRGDEAVASVVGSVSESLKNAALDMYKAGLVDTDEEQSIDLMNKISCGESLRYAYRFVCGLTECSHTES